MDKFGGYFDVNRFDLLIILGDRYEMLSIATAAAMHRIPILHIHGGEATYGRVNLQQSYECGEQKRQMFFGGKTTG